jgi:hypothetical protein
MYFKMSSRKLSSKLQFLPKGKIIGTKCKEKKELLDHDTIRSVFLLTPTPAFSTNTATPPSITKQKYQGIFTALLHQ